eukprot:CAMPEP_0172529040 /NCGR_PEP_ID=MMETSP1067-20121228/3223_1 /TAXON_ID=265564 ORGANISM="Thalassiosira punctigera, Strain Tpunct2005C2" /NCGR_SAMPLE_ID=MMETSP1067 /ASSEMBLY_ACC=CAM_ASM_000444 /LENGTH=475 /DNA_ID=CAMNT_0013313029 /DNA_START=7 /DNA_END=1434 /DNA_ORIENTATION=+
MTRTTILALVLATSSAFSPAHISRSSIPLSALYNAYLSSLEAGGTSFTTPAEFEPELVDPVTALPSFDEYLDQREKAEIAADEGSAAAVAAHEAPSASFANNEPATSTSSSRDRSSIQGQHNIGSLLLQRAIQTQLYYLSDLRDEPTYTWLRGFLSQNHLDDRGKYNELDGLTDLPSGGWRTYLQHLEEAPSFTFTVQLAPPRLSAQQRRNPFLAAQATQGRSYEETINPSKISRTIRAVARSLEREWVETLTELAQKDRERVQLHLDPYGNGNDLDGIPRLQTKEDREREFWLKRQVVAGGEGDDQGTPLHTLNEMMVARFITRVALHRLLDELREDAAVAASPLSNGASATDSLGNVAVIDNETKQSAAQYILQFSNEWTPKLRAGPDFDARKSLGAPPPGQWQRLCRKGATADDVTEALWQELPQNFALVHGEASMKLYSSEALSARLRMARAEVCGEVIDELRLIVANEFC